MKELATFPHALSIASASAFVKLPEEKEIECLFCIKHAPLTMTASVILYLNWVFAFKK